MILNFKDLNVNEKQDFLLTIARKLYFWKEASILSFRINN